MTETNSDEDRMLTVSQVCAQIGIGRMTFYKLVSSGELDAININPAATGPKPFGAPGPRRTLRVRQSEVTAFIERNKVSA